MHSTRLARVVVALALLLPASSAFSFETAYWGWQRDEPPSERDLVELSAQRVSTLYWQVGQLENTDGRWRWKARFKLPSVPGLKIVPVLRLESRNRAPFTPEATGSLLKVVSSVTPEGGPLQIDFDCPDRLLVEYATMLQQIRKLVPELSITALPGWIRQPALSELANSVTEIFPMFYDFEPDPVVPEAAPVPVVNPESAKAWLQEWSHCRTPWRAGLPNFARLTVYDASGKSLGHIREWSWDSVCFNQALVPEQDTHLGVTLFRTRAATQIGNTLLHEKQLLGARWPDRAALSELIGVVKKTSALGMVMFRLPDSTAASGWSFRQLQDLDAAPRLVLRKVNDSQPLELTNEGGGDLAPIFRAGNEPTGYVVQIEAQTAIFREAEEGEFLRVHGEVERDAKASTVLIPLATRLCFSFSQLRAGQSLKSGLIRLAPGADFTQTRFRIVNSGQSEWKSFPK